MQQDNPRTTKFTFSIRKTDPEKSHFLFFLAEASSILCGASAPFCLLSPRLLSHLSFFGHCCDEKFPFYISSQRKSARQGLKRGSLILCYCQEDWLNNLLTKTGISCLLKNGFYFNQSPFSPPHENCVVRCFRSTTHWICESCSSLVLAIS